LTLLSGEDYPLKLKLKFIFNIDFNRFPVEMKEVR